MNGAFAWWMAHGRSLPILIVVTGAVRDRHDRGQLPERLHLSDPLAEERDLAGLALPEVLSGDRAARQHPDRRAGSRCGASAATAAAGSRRVIRWSRRWSACCSSARLRRRRGRRTEEPLGRDPAGAVARGWFYSCRSCRAAGRGDVHRLRPDDHPRRDHRDRHGRRDRPGDAWFPEIRPSPSTRGDARGRLLGRDDRAAGRGGC